jgi:anti-sigma-K factor RskA
MRVHQQFAEDLALHALGSLSGEEKKALDRHLAECSACRRELEELHGDAALLALSASGPLPPQRARERLLAAIAREPGRVQAKREGRRSIWNWIAVPAFVAAIVLAVVAVVFWRQNTYLREAYQALLQQSAQDQAAVHHARELLAMFTAPEAVRVTLVATKTAPQPQGKAMYLPREGALLFMASNLAPPPERKIYELWLLPKGGSPMPAGTFRPDARGNALIMDPPLPKGTEAKAFAVTIEPEGGSSVPTMPILMMGAGS